MSGDVLAAWDYLRDDSPASLRWQAEQHELTMGEISSDARLTTLLALLSQLVCEPIARPTRVLGGRTFTQETRDGNVVVSVRDASGSRVLVDSSKLSAEAGHPLSVDTAVPSPDGTLLAFTTMEHGDEQMSLHIVRSDDGIPLDGQLPVYAGIGLTWLPDSRSLLYPAREVVDGVFQMPMVRAQISCSAVTTSREAMPLCGYAPKPIVSADGATITAIGGYPTPRSEFISEAGQWRPFLQGIEGGHHGVFLEDSYVAIVTAGAPRGRLVRIPLTTASEPSTWTELIPETDDVLIQVDRVDEVAVLAYLRDAGMGLRLLRVDGTIIDDLSLHSKGSISAVRTGIANPWLPCIASCDDGFSFAFASFTQSPAGYRYSLSQRELIEIDPPEFRLDGIVVREITATSADGTLVPATLVQRADLGPGPHPTLIHAYGGFNLAWIPTYISQYAAFVQSGGVYVFAHLRGGGEYGADWWQQGRFEHKQNTFDDLFAVGEELICQGIAESGRLAFQGDSNGGMVAGAAVTQRPDLWGAVVGHVPILDLLNCDRDPLSLYIAKDEYGDPTDAVQREWLAGYSPVQNVTVGTTYPATLFVAGASDPRCPPWHARLMVARMQAGTTGPAPIRLIVNAESGHGALTRSAAVQEAAEWLTFLMQALNMTPGSRG